MLSKLDLIQLAKQTKKYNVMIVEECVEENNLLTSIFKNFFSETVSIYSSSDALNIYKKMTYDVIFINSDMHEISAIELTRRIRMINPFQIIVMISSYCNIEQTTEAMAAGVNSFIEKPIDLNQIFNVLENVTHLINKKNFAVKKFSISLPIELDEILSKNSYIENISKSMIITKVLQIFYAKIAKNESLD